MPHGLLSEAERLGLAGVRAALATVIRTSGSVPRKPPAKMIVRADGAIAGTIGGGRIEKEVIEAALPVARGTAPAVRLEKHLVQDLAMCCGGRMELWIEPLDGARWKAMGEAARRRARRRPSALVTELGGPGGGGKDLAAADDCLLTRRVRLSDTRFVEPVLPADRLVLFGAGHVAHAVARVGAGVGFERVVADEAEDWATADRFPAALLCHSYDPRDVDRDAGPLAAGDFVLIMTRDHAVDQAILEALLPRAPELAYLGLIGSTGKVGRFRKRLEAKGIFTEDRWARLHAPVGLDIGAETPEEIAVAIVAELVRVRARGAGGGAGAP